jgi:hypothetical protein
MTPAAIALAILNYGPSILPVMAQVAAWIKEGKKEVTPEDIQLLISYGKKTSDDYLAEVGMFKAP